METNSYHRIKDFIFTNLKKNTNLLSEGQIKTEISNAQNLIKAVGINTFAQFLADKSELKDLPDDDWLRMERELETHFNVEMKDGILIKGEEQQRRDTNWWSNKEKIKGENFYWKRYESYIKGFLPPEVVITIDKDTDLVMDNIGDPNLPETFDRKGMVVGHVQSGKTGNYSALVCKASDAGYKFIVVIAGGINNLRDQTQHRLNEAFVGQDKGTQIGAGIGNTNAKKLPICLTTTEKDFNKQDADRNSHSINFDNIKSPILIVIKKNTSTLKSVIKWLRNQYKNKINHAMLVIDDESDYASINTNDENNPTVINKNIRDLLSLFTKSSYVAYTATPYANIFIDHEATHNEYGDDLFPKDFIYALDAPSNYFGARKIFVNTEDKHLVTISEKDTNVIPLNHKKEFPISKLPESLYEAVRLFLLNVAIRKKRGQGQQHNSMLIHISRFTAIHQKIAFLIERYLFEIRKDINSFGKLPDAERHSKHIKDLKETLELQLSERNSSESWDEIISTLTDCIDTIIVREVHQKTLTKLEYRNDVTTNAIVIGGASLSRGFTVEGLSVSYFLRSTIFYDTLMQMGRWFGYRSGYEDLCRIYLPDQIITHFRDIIEATDELIQDLKVMAEKNLTPNDFGLAVKQHPDSALQITARNKQREVHKFDFDMKLDGHLKETGYLSDKEAVRNQNYDAIVTVINKLTNIPPLDINGSKLWANADKTIVKEFLDDFEVFTNDPLGITGRMPIGFIKQYVAENDMTWDIALYSGSGTEIPIGNIKIKKEKRRVKHKTDHYVVTNRQVSSGDSEEISLNEKQRKELSGNRKEVRKVPNRRPLLMLHILETEDNGDFAAFGISFPGDSAVKGKTVTKTINSVYYANLLKELEEDEEDE
jgi:hypothetical protein